MKKQTSTIPEIASILSATLAVTTEASTYLKQNISTSLQIGQESAATTIITSAIISLILWISYRGSAEIYGKIFYQLLGKGGSIRGTYIYTAQQKIDNNTTVKILGVFYINDTIKKTEINYAEAYYWEDNNELIRRGSWTSSTINNDSNNTISFPYQIKVDKNSNKTLATGLPEWTGFLMMRKQIPSKNESLALGIEAWRGISEGKNFESQFYCERITKNLFIPAEEIHLTLRKKFLFEKLASKLTT